MAPCDCPSDNFVCHAIEGCVCRRGLAGEHCDQKQSELLVLDQAASSSTVGTAVLISIIIIGVVIAILILVYYRKRVNNLKREIAHVQYIADPHSQPDRHHFDNPVYSYQNGIKPDDSTGLLNNAANHIKNNLNFVKKNNTDIEKLRMAGASCSNDADELYDPTMSLKNRDADATNPNMYHCIDEDSKVDHVYDEIKHKEGLEMEYDHLNYTPAASAWKPHYQRMANGFLAKQDNTAPPAMEDPNRPPSPPQQP